MAKYQLNASKWPLVTIIATESSTKAELDEHFREYRKLLDRNQAYAVIFDATSIGAPAPSVRKQFADFLTDNAPDMRRLCKGTAFVISSALVRGALTALLWLMRELPFPYQVVESRMEAEQWAQDQLTRSSPAFSGR